MTITLAPSAADAANPAPQIFSIDQLAISPLNVRFNEEDCEAVDALQASIVAEGLIQSLTLHPVPKGAKWAGKAQFGVFAGGRRYRAIRRAIDAGELPPDFPIHATVRDLPKGAIILMSLSENLIRRTLRDYEVYRAIAAAHAEGLAPDEIAKQTGQRPAEVARWLRLGELHPDILTAYVSGAIDQDQAKAFASTEDRDLQAEAWKHFTKLRDYERNPSAIRAFFKVGDRELTRNLQFVGEAIYRGNGGRFELDLFADGPDSMRGRVTDEALLARLVNEKMDVVRGLVRSAWGERELRFQAEPPQQKHVAITDRDLEVRPRKSDWETARIPRGADPADFVATIGIEPNGDWTAQLWWKSRAAKAAFEKSNSPAAGSTKAHEDGDTASAYQAVHGKLGPGQAIEHTNYSAQQEAHRVVRDAHGLTKDGINIVRTIRRDLLRWALLCTPERDVPADYLTWSALRQELANDRASRTGARGIAAEGWSSDEREPTELMKDQREAQEGFAFWQDRLTILREHPAFAGDDAAAGLRAYLSASPALKRTAESILAGLALVRSAASAGWNVPAHEVLMKALGFEPIGLRNAWYPTAAFTGLFGKMARQELVQPFIDEGERRALAKAKDRDLSRRTAEILASESDWLHPLLGFQIEKVAEHVTHDESRDLEPAQ